MSLAPELLVVLISATLPLAAKILGDTIKRLVVIRSRSKTQKVEVKSASGNTVVIEIKEGMNKQETDEVIKRLQNFAQRTSNGK